MRTRFYAAAILSMAAGNAMAHDGHGISGLFHYLIEPAHALPVVIVLVAAALLARRALKRH